MKVGKVIEAIFKQTCSRVRRSHQSTHVDVGRGNVAVPQQTLERVNILSRIVLGMLGWSSLGA